MRVRLTDEWHKRGHAMAVPGATFEDGAWWITDPSDKAAAYALALFPELANDHPELATRRDRLYGQARPHDFASEVQVRLSAVSGGWRGLDVEPYTFQDIDTGYLREQLQRGVGAGILGWDRGLGKTISSLAIARGLGAKRILVVCGNTMKQSVWGDEIAARWPDAKVHVLPNPRAQRERFCDELAADATVIPDDPTVVVVHYEALAIIDRYKRGWARLGRWDLMIFDESHRLANPKTQLHRAAKRAAKNVSARMALTGTAVMNHPEDLYGQLNWLFPDTYKSKWRDYNDRFVEFVRTDYGQVCVGFKPQALEQLRRELGVFMVYRTKDDVLDLPGRTEEVRHVPLLPAQKKAYDELRDRFWTEYDGEVIQASNALAQLNLLRRVATGLDAIKGEVADSSKLDFAVELIEETQDEAFVVFSWYKAPLYSLHERLGRKSIDAHIVTGDTKQSDRAAAVDAFQAGHGRVFLGTLSTLGESVNLQRASSAIFLDRAWNPAVNAQAADRIYRIGQDRHVTITHLVAPGTVDDLRVQPVLASKDAMRKALFGG